MFSKCYRLKLVIMQEQRGVLFAICRQYRAQVVAQNSLHFFDDNYLPISITVNTISYVLLSVNKN